MRHFWFSTLFQQLNYWCQWAFSCFVIYQILQDLFLLFTLEIHFEWQNENRLESNGYWIDFMHSLIWIDRAPLIFRMIVFFPSTANCVLHATLKLFQARESTPKLKSFQCLMLRSSMDLKYRWSTWSGILPVYPNSYAFAFWLEFQEE